MAWVILIWWRGSARSLAPMHASCQISTALHSGRFTQVATMQRRCGMVWGRAILSATTNKRMIAHARTISPANQSTAATFRNIPAHNAIVIMQTTQTAFHKQRKRDNANNASMIMVKHRAHNAIVISQSRGQAFVTFCNISSAYLSYKASLCSTFVLCATSELAQVRLYYSTPVLFMSVCAYNGSVMMR